MGHRARADRFFRDRQGTVWASTDRGVLRWQGEQWQGFAPVPSWPVTGCSRFLKTAKATCGRGRNPAALNLLRDQKFTTYSTRDGLSGNFVRSVFQGGDGTLWIGTDGAGLNRRDGERLCPLFHRRWSFQQCDSGAGQRGRQGPLGRHA